MTPLTNFVMAFLLSFAGSIPPGTINLTVIQLGLEGKLKIAFRFSLAAAFIEYPYAWVAVKFERLISASPALTENFQLITALVLITLAIVNLWPAKESKPKYLQSISQSGYRRGLLLGILNPLAIPYWLGISAYLESQHWIDLSSPARLHSFLLGVVLGAFILLVLLAYLSGRIVRAIEFPWVKKVPGLLLLLLGIYGLIEYLL